MTWLTLAEGWHIALDVIRANKLRSGLTILGVAIGVSVVMAMASMITGIRTSIFEAFEAAGPENFIVTRFDMTEVRFVNDGMGRPPWWDKPKITPFEANRIGRLPAVAEAVVDFDFESSMEFEGREVAGIQSSADDAPWPSYSIGGFVAGRNFLPSDVARSRPVVVLSERLAQDLFGQRDPIGQRIRVRHANRATTAHFTVVGVYRIGENVFAEAVKHFALFPYTGALKHLNADAAFLSVLVVPAAGYTQQEAIDQVIGALRALRGLRPAEPNNFAVLRSEQIVETFNDLTRVFFLVMLALSSVALMVGGVGVIGIMMISVTERTREIGIRKAVGATRQEILWQFLVEAATLTLIGGGVGLALGGAIAQLVEAATPIPARVPLWSVAVALTAAVITGMLFGLLPAYRAARLDPVVSLRYE
ncbi:MAG: ABC transporter permease [Gemmatimonadetes bacterium]|nr:ABC transporter permease [Gemmatimonadota bacterium]